MSGPKQRALGVIKLQRNDLNRKIQTRLGRITVLQQELQKLTAERDAINRKLPAMETEAHRELMASLD